MSIFFSIRIVHIKNRVAQLETVPPVIAGKLDPNFVLRYRVLVPGEKVLSNKDLYCKDGDQRFIFEQIHAFLRTKNILLRLNCSLFSEKNEVELFYAL